MICSIEDLPPELAASVTPEEREHVAGIERRGLLPFAVTRHFASLACGDSNDPIRRQFFPDPREAIRDPFALDDPLGEACHCAAPRLVHQYRDRALMLSAGTCAGYCRHCFRRVWLSAASVHAEAGLGDLTAETAYLAAHPEIREVLVSGGDPLSLGDDRLATLLAGIRAARPGVALRICSRDPITDPGRLGGGTVAMLAGLRPLTMAVHINHPRELSPESRAALAAVIFAGIEVKVQTVLLRGVNDDAPLLADLFRECLGMGLEPYYLFQMDLAPGTAHFRVPLRRGLAIFRELRGMCLGRWLPAYAVDLPGGGGKIRLDENVITGERITEKGAEYVLRDAAGREWFYPAE